MYVYAAKQLDNIKIKLIAKCPTRQQFQNPNPLFEPNCHRKRNADNNWISKIIKKAFHNTRQYLFSQATFGRGFKDYFNAALCRKYVYDRIREKSENVDHILYPIKWKTPFSTKIGNPKTFYIATSTSLKTLNTTELKSGLRRDSPTYCYKFDLRATVPPTLVYSNQS